MKYTVRIHRYSGQPELFFYEGAELTSYSRAEQHTPASIGYMRHATRPPHGPFEVQACDTLARAWLALTGADSVAWVRVARMSRLARGGA